VLVLIVDFFVFILLEVKHAVNGSGVLAARFLHALGGASCRGGEENFELEAAGLFDDFVDCCGFADAGSAGND